MTFLPVDSQQQQWNLVFQECETLFKKLEGILKKYNDYTCIFLILINLLKVNFIINAKVNFFKQIKILQLNFNFKSIFESLTKVLCFIIRNCYFKLDHIIEICTLCLRAFSKVFILKIFPGTFYHKYYN